MKFLYNDGSGKIREVSSKEELDYYLSISPDKNRVRIWLFHTSSWITYQEYLKAMPQSDRTSAYAKASADEVVKPETEKRPVIITTPIIETPKETKAETVEPPFIFGPAPPAKEKNTRPQTVTKPLQILLNICIVLVVAGGVYAALFYNKKEWTEPRVFETAAPRPANVPNLNLDSLVQMVEVKELRTLNKITKMNLRLRNNWPEKIVLTLQGEQQKHLKKDSVLRFNELQMIVKNFSGYEIDAAVAAVNVWENGEVSKVDTFRLSNIGYRDPYTQTIPNTYKGDSLTVHFYSIRSFGLNFCYSYDEPTISGNPNDKWFCKD